jgi:hypothetical protein
MLDKNERGLWKLARIEAVLPTERDDQVRRVRVRAGSTVYERSTHSLSSSSLLSTEIALKYRNIKSEIRRRKKKSRKKKKQKRKGCVFRDSPFPPRLANFKLSTKPVNSRIKLRNFVRGAKILVLPPGVDLACAAAS